ncbi:unnamed protein product [Closterium sp. NIES-65]|nr:unnamed protein product [Closterium sp. NIES-65]
MAGHPLPHHSTRSSRSSRCNHSSPSHECCSREHSACDHDCSCADCRPLGDCRHQDGNVAAMAAAVRQGRVSRQSLERHYRGKCVQLNPEINAVCHLARATPTPTPPPPLLSATPIPLLVNSGTASGTALGTGALGASADSGDALPSAASVERPLEGVPFLVKDLVHVAGQPTACGDERLAAQPAPPTSASAVSLLQSLGAVPLGKTNVPHLSMDFQTFNSLFGVTSNPINQSLTPGGSSGGSAAAVAAGMVPFALGTDLEGSLRLPASFCGICSLRPSRDRWPVLASDVPLPSLALLSSLHTYGVFTVSPSCRFPSCYVHLSSFLSNLFSLRHFPSILSSPSPYPSPLPFLSPSSPSFPLSPQPPCSPCSPSSPPQRTMRDLHFIMTAVVSRLPPPLRPSLPTQPPPLSPPPHPLPPSHLPPPPLRVALSLHLPGSPIDSRVSYLFRALAATSAAATGGAAVPGCATTVAFSDAENASGGGSACREQQQQQQQQQLRPPQKYENGRRVEFVLVEAPRLDFRALDKASKAFIFAAHQLGGGKSSKHGPGDAAQHARKSLEEEAEAERERERQLWEAEVVAARRTQEQQQAVLDSFLSENQLAAWILPGHPVVSMPLGWVDGLPCGMQVVGHMGQDIPLLHLCCRIEAHLQQVGLGLGPGLGMEQGGKVAAIMCSPPPLFARPVRSCL